MLDRRAQIVIGIGILVISAAFLLVGIYFANLQGLIFQNGAQAMQLFSNNMASAINSLYGAPSSMQISLAGNSSLCSWNPASDAYDCSGGSKIYNLSYATGPTVDSGQGMFSVALCFTLGYGFGKFKTPPGISGTADEATRVGATVAERVGTEATISEVSSEVAHESAAQAASSLPSDIKNMGNNIPDIAKSTIIFDEEGNVIAASFEDLGGNTLSAIKTPNGFIRTLEDSEGNLLKADLMPLEEPSTVEQIVDEGAVLALPGTAESPSATISRAVKALVISSVSLSSALVVFPIVAFWFGSSSSNVNVYVNKGITINGQQIGALTGPSNSISNQIAAAYLSQEPLPFKYDAMNLALQSYSKTLSAAIATENLPTSVLRYNMLADAYQEALVKQQDIAQVSAAAGGGSSNTYSTPTNGVTSPTSLSASQSFVGTVDPGYILSDIRFLAVNSLLVYGRTASCMGSLSQLSDLSSWNGLGAVGNGAEVLGYATTFLNIYTKTNNVMPLGSYFVGYGGETYVTGQSSGRPTVASSPIISDLSDLCSIAETSSEPGQNLNTLIIPSGNGSISFSINQGLYNTMCSNRNALFPNTLSDFVNKIVSSDSPSESVSILLPPQYVLGIYNSSNSSNICIFRSFIQAYGSPIMFTESLDGFSRAVLGFGIPVSCINMTQMSGGDYNLGFNATRTGGGNSFGLSGQIDSSAFFINNDSIVGFSAPLGDYPNAYSASGSLAAGSYISGTGDISSLIAGVDSPVVNAIAAIFKKSAPKLQGAIQDSLVSSLITGLTKYNGLYGPSNLSFYQTDYTNVTLNIVKTQQNGGNYYNIVSANSNLVFGVYPNSDNTFGGTYVS